MIILSFIANRLLNDLTESSEQVREHQTCQRALPIIEKNKNSLSILFVRVQYPEDISVRRISSGSVRTLPLIQGFERFTTPKEDLTHLCYMCFMVWE
jgi:hypothetical protein